MSAETTQLSLLILEGPSAGQRIPVPATGPLVVGRDRKCSLPIDDDGISLRHCAIEALPDRPGVVVTDLMTGGQTRVNQQAVMQQVMRAGDQLQLGSTTVIELQVKRSPSRPPSSTGSGRYRSTRMLRATTAEVEIVTPADVEQAVAEVKRLAAEVEFDDGRIGQLGIAVREVAENALRHAGGGQFTARRTRRGLRVEVWDTGPGIPMDVLQELNAGLEDANTEGEATGIHLARRIVDQLSVISLPGNTQIIMEIRA